MTETELSTAIKTKTLTGCLFFYGDEDYMKNHRIADLRRMVTEGAEDFASFNVIEISFGEREFNLSALSDALYTPPVFSEKKLVVLSVASLDGLKEKERTSLLSALEEFTKQADGSTVAVLKVCAGGFDPGSPKKPTPFLAAAQKFMQCVAFDYQSDGKLFRWMERHFASCGLSLPAPSAQLILSTCGRSMYRLSGEIAKTAAYVASRGKTVVTEEDVSACVTRTDEDEAFLLTNCILEGNTAAALQALGVKIRKKEDPIFLLSQITRTMGDLCMACTFLSDGRDKADYARTLKIHEYRAGLYYRAAKLRSPAFFAKAATLCADTDRAMKNGPSSGDGYGLLEQLVCSLCGQ